MSIINKIIELAEEKSINQQVICDALGIKSGTFSTWKSRETDPPAKYIACICEVLDVSIEYLLTGKEKNSVTELTGAEKRLLAAFKELTRDEQMAEVGRIEHMAEQASKAKNAETA